MLDGLQYQWLLDDKVDMVRCYRVLYTLLTTQLTADGDAEADPPIGTRQDG